MSSPERKLFGTDGIRGVANQYPMTAEVALSLGRALAHVFKNGHRHRRILIGKDTRLSCYMLEMAMASGICSMGADVLLLGPMPTPGIAFLTRAMRADAGVVISASHNLFQDNGIKVFDRDGYKLPDSLELEIEDLVLSDKIASFRPTAEKIGKAKRVEESKGRYIEFVKRSFPRAQSLEGLKIVLDCAHGAAYEIAPIIFNELGAELICLGVNPDGFNINRDGGALHPAQVALAVKEQGADIGIALDGDADRVVLVDEKGHIIDGDAILAFCGEVLLQKGKLKQNTVVTTVMSNIGLDDYLSRLDGKVLRVPVGDRYIIERMRRDGFNFGGESSGHLIFFDQTTSGDGMIAALQVLSHMITQGKPISELVSRYHAYPQVLKNVRIKKREKLELFPKVTQKISEVEKILGTKGRVLIRYSGTEPLVRVMVEGEDQKTIQGMAQDIVQCIERELNGQAGDQR